MIFLCIIELNIEVVRVFDHRQWGWELPVDIVEWWASQTINPKLKPSTQRCFSSNIWLHALKNCLGWYVIIWRKKLALSCIYVYRWKPSYVEDCGRESDHEFISKEYISVGMRPFGGSPKQSHESLCSKWTISYHEFISKEYISIGMRPFGGSPKQSHESLCSKWTISYHFGESWFLTWYQSHALNLAMSIESSNVEQRSCEPRRCSQKWLKCQTKDVLCSRAPENESSLD